MNIVELINKIKAIAFSMKMVHSVFDGDVYKNWNSTEVKYGSVNVSIESISRSNNQMDYSLILYYGDKLLQDDSNANAIWTDGVNILQSIINKLEEDMDVSYPISYTPFS